MSGSTCKTGAVSTMADLAASALLGTDRSGGKGGSGAAGLLREAAILGARRRAGFRAAQVKSDAGAGECPADRAPVVNSACAATLRLLLTNSDSDLLTEWVGLAAAKGRRTPDSLAPALLSWCLAQGRVVTGQEAVLGARMEWLCSLNREWAARRDMGTSTLPTDVDGAWQTGTALERATLLTGVRKAEPGRAETLLRGTWGQDGADERARFVGCFAHGLSMSDEAFLEGALDDKSKQVREMAAALLARLPESRLVARMVVRACGMVRAETKKKLLGKAKVVIEVEPIAEWDKAWERDGLEEKAPGGMGKRAWWLHQVLGMTRPRVLAGRLGVNAEQLIEGVTMSEYAVAGIAGLCAGAALAKDREWCELLAAAALEEKKPNPERIGELVRGLPAADAEAVIGGAISDARLELMERWALLGDLGHAWSTEFSERACRAVMGGKKLDRVNSWHVVPSAEKVSRRIHPCALLAFETAVRESLADEPPPAALRSIDRVRRRADMHKEFET